MTIADNAPMSDRPTFLSEPPAGDGIDAAYEADRQGDGYVWNVTRLWGWRPDVYEAFAKLRADLMGSSGLTDRDWAIMVTATAAERRDSYCALAWGPKLAKLSDDATAAQLILAGPTPELSKRETALAAWARQLVRDPNATTERDLDRLREVGLSDREIFEATAFVGFRLAFATVNDALGAAPDKQLAEAAPKAIRAAVTFGRAPAAEPSRS